MSKIKDAIIDNEYVQGERNYNEQRALLDADFARFVKQMEALGQSTLARRTAHMLQGGCAFDDVDQFPEPSTAYEDSLHTEFAGDPSPFALGY